MTENHKRIFTAIGVAVLAVVGIWAWIGVFSPSEVPPSAEAEPMTETQVTCQFLGVFEGRVALFEGENPEPSEVFDVVVETLPPEEQQRLQNRIAIDSEEMLDNLLENYTS